MIRYFLTIFTLFTFISVNGAEVLYLSADSCRKMAEDSSRELKSAKLAERQAEYDKKVADISRLPKVEASAMGMYMFPDMDMMEMQTQMHGAYLAGLQITQPIYAGGKITAGRRLARVGKRVAAEQARLTRMDVASQAMHSYWTYIAVLDKVKLASAIMP